MAVVKTTTATVTTTGTSAVSIWNVASSRIAVWAKIFKTRTGINAHTEAFFIQGSHFTNFESTEVTTSDLLSPAGTGTVAFVTNVSDNIELQVTSTSSDSTDWIAEISYFDENS